MDVDADTDDEEEEDEVAVMVPMADMLNAAFEMDNARLFHEDDCLKMVSTTVIPKGEQIVG
jgi:SET domain-containing protein 6